MQAVRLDVLGSAVRLDVLGSAVHPVGLVRPCAAVSVVRARVLRQHGVLSVVVRSAKRVPGSTAGTGAVPVPTG